MDVGVGCGIQKNRCWTTVAEPRRAKTAASAARAALGETALQQAVAGEPINRKKLTAKSWRGDRDPACSVQ